MKIVPSLPLDKQLSDNSRAFIRSVKAKIGKQVPIQQCCVYFTGKLENEVTKTTAASMNCN
jgi:hypothetical protein